MCIRDSLYTLAIIAVYSTLSAAVFLQRLYSIVYSCVTVMNYIVNALQILILIVCQSNLYRCQRLNSNIYDNLAYLDKSLESLGVQPPYARNKLEGIFCVIIGVVMCSIYVYVKPNNFSTFNSSIISLGIVFRNVFLISCCVFFGIFCYFTYYIIYQRARLIRDAVERFVKRTGVCVAWSSDVTISCLLYTSRCV